MADMVQSFEELTAETRSLSKGTMEIIVYPFTTPEIPELAQVGGKGLSLILMTQQGLPVPPGFVLSVAFFKPWLEYIQSTPEWRDVLPSSPEDLKQSCDTLKRLAMDLELDDRHREVLTKTLEPLKIDGELPLLAIRSSSPEEDLEGASFAGGYETSLGVTKDGLEDAVRRSFASCLDERVFLYKKEHGFAVDQPRIAVIVQQQIAAQTAGVAFSLNPLNNCYDEAVINANFGLGESVVSGLASPDSFTVDKVSRAILERKTGKKERAIWLAPDGGTYEEPSPSRAQLCLSDEAVLTLTDMLVEAEKYYQKPIDIEWAFAAETLYLLQARPITAYIPLPDELITPPGEPKRLYNDLTLVKWGMPKPWSVLGQDYMTIANLGTLRTTVDKDLDPETAKTLRRNVGGRTYANLSISLKMQGKKRVASLYRAMDALSAEILAQVDETEYVFKKLPPALKGIVFKAIRQNLGLGWDVLKGYLNPAQCRRRYLEAEAQLRKELAGEAEVELPLREFATRTIDRMMAYMIAFGPLMAVAEIARSRIKHLFKDDDPEVRRKVVYLERALPNNITIEMGLAMHRLASLADIRECTSGKVFTTRLKARSFSAEFLKAWDMFIEAYGFRCPGEMDPATPRYYEQPAQLFEQLRLMNENTDGERNPQAVFDKAKAERGAAYEDLLQVAQKKGKRKAKAFKKHYNTLVELGGYRETPKYYFVLMTDMFRRRVLETAQPLIEAGRLDDLQQTFNLTLDDIEKGIADPRLDLRTLAEKNTRFLKKIQHIREFPRIIDSRGKILRPPKKEAGEGELVGEPISPGVIRGKVKVLHRPDEKPILPGDILVTQATDPGWTPLFINAGGIILEVGGLLQHGALVAREYGKPCVAGIENVTSILKDGQMVEMDGLGGIVRLR